MGHSVPFMTLVTKRNVAGYSAPWGDVMIERSIPRNRVRKILDAHLSANALAR